MSNDIVVDEPQYDNSFLGNPNLKPVGFKISYTYEQVKEILACSSDPIYFIERYCYIVSLDKGLVLFNLYECQKEKIKTIMENRKIIEISSRQSGKTITTAACILWYSLFQSSKTVAILANKANSAREVLHRYQIMYENLPIWMQQGVKIWNKGDVELENGSRVFTAATSASAIRGRSCVTGDTKVCLEKNDGFYFSEIDKLINGNKLILDKENKFKYAIYKTINKISKKEFIGYHSFRKNNLFTLNNDNGSCFIDGYLGSGKLIKKVIEKHGPENFKQVIIEIFDSIEEALELGKKYSGDNFAVDNLNEKNVKILGKNGFQDFEGFINQGMSSSLYLVKFSDNTYIKATGDHLFLDSNSQWIQCELLMEGDILFGNKTITSISQIENEIVYDALNVNNGHNYYTNGVVSHNCNWLYVDEAALIPNNMADEFFTSVYPTISSGETTKILLTSTPMGYNHFWKFWNEAQNNRNGFVPIFIPYNKIPGRDQKWADEQRALLGDLKFNQEIACLGGESKITLKNKETGEIFETTLEKAFNIEFIYKYEILTREGFSDFLGLRCKPNEALEFVFEDDSNIVSSLDHVFYFNDKPLVANEIKIGTILGENKKVKNIINRGILPLYDPIHVFKNNRYLASDLEHHNCQFLGSSNTLIPPEIIGRMSPSPFTYSKDGLDIIEDPIRTVKNIDEKIITMPHLYFLVADTSRGVGGDFSAFTVIDITEYPYKVVAKYKDNKINPLLYPTVIAKVANDYNKAFVLVEINDIGQQIANTLYMDLEYENVLAVSYDGKTGQFLSAGFKAGTSLGVRTTKQVKRLGCQLLKGLVENNKFLINDSDIISELSTFIEQRGSYAADLGYHDDLVMTLVLFAWASNELYFKELTNTNLRVDLYKNQIQDIEEDLTPFGFIDDGIDDMKPEVDTMGGDIWFHKDLNAEMEKLKNKWYQKA